MSSFTQVASPDTLKKHTQAVLDLPFHKYLGITLAAQTPGEARIELRANKDTGNITGIMHGGILYALLDTCCYLALLPLFEESEHAVSHDVHVSILRPARSDAPVTFTGRVVQKGRRLIFCESEARQGGKLVATARVTKSPVPRSIES